MYARRVPDGCQSGARACPGSVGEQRAARAARRDRPQVERALLVRGESDRAPVGGPGRLAVVGRPAREPAHALPIDADRMEVVVRLRPARPREPRAVGRPRRLHVLATPRPREPLDHTGGDVCHVQLPVSGALAREREAPPRRRHGEIGVARLQPRERDTRGPVRQHRGRAVAVHHDDRRPGAEPARSGGTRHVRDHERERDEQRRATRRCRRSALARPASPSTLACRARRHGYNRCPLQGFPSGQRGRAVNPLAQPSEVRILLPALVRERDSARAESRRSDPRLRRGRPLKASAVAAATASCDRSPSRTARGSIDSARRA